MLKIVPNIDQKIDIIFVLNATKPNDTNKFIKHRQNIGNDRHREEKEMRERMDEYGPKSEDSEQLKTSFPWNKPNLGHEVQRKRETDLFLDTLGGPGGTVVRYNGLPPLTDPHFTQQQHQYETTKWSEGLDPKEMEQYKNKIEQVSHDKEIGRHQRRISDVRKDLDYVRHATGRGGTGSSNIRTYSSSDSRAQSKISEGRSLDLETTKGGAGAPVRDLWGKHVTRMPITLSRDDYGESNIKEDIPGKATFDLDFTNEENKPYYPWGGQGGGAPIRNRDGNVVTQIFGKLEGRESMDGELRRNRRRQEVFYNELKECERQQREKKEELDRYMKAPQAELAELLIAGRVGKPKRDDITGEVGQQHLSNSDVSKWKMNYQPVSVSEKKRYHDELVSMAEERHAQKKLEKLKERQESNSHFQNMDSTWGAIGGGAPKHPVVRKKVNLTNSLFYPQTPLETSRFEEPDYMPPTGLGSFNYYQQVPSLGYQKVYQENDSRLYPSTYNSPRHVKTTIRSSHRNQFDSVGDQKVLVNGGHHTAPYATDR